MNRFGRSLVPVLLMGVGGCGEDSGSPTDTQQQPDTVEIFSWWTAGGEKEALDAVLALHTESHPDTTISNIALEGGGMNARERLEERLRAGTPPELFQSNFGTGAMRNWLEFIAPGEPTIEPLDELFDEEGWSTAFPQLLRDSVSVDGQVYAVPLNVHRTNSLFYNVKIFEDNGLEPPSTLDEFYAVGDALLALDPPIVPLALGSAEPWTMSLMMMENLLISTAGPEYYQTFFSGAGDPDDPEMLANLQEMITLWQGYVNENAGDLTWDEATQMVADGDAAMTIMGDWAKGYLVNAGLTPGVDFGQVPTFGTADTFVFSGDCFPIAVDAANMAGGLELLRTLGSKEAQDVFNPIKGSIPARTDADVSLYDELSQATYADFKDSNVTLVLSVAGLVPSGFGDAIAGAAPDMLEAGDPEPMLAALRGAYPLLKE